MKLPSMFVTRWAAVILACVGCLVVIAALFFRVVDAALEIDDLKSSANFRYKEMHALMAITNASLASCGLKVDEFESVVRDSGLPPIRAWESDTILVGSFKVTRKGDCITHIAESM